MTTRPWCREKVMVYYCVIRTALRALVVITWRGDGCRYMMRLGETVNRAQLLKIKEQVSGIWDKGCMLDDCACII